MTASQQRLATLLARLEEGDDDERAEIVRRALLFKRAWVELAQGLARLQRSQAFSRWGYEDLHAYCSGELMIKPATVDKLLLSLSAVRTHAPDVLRQGRRAADVPSLESVDYFARALNLTDKNENDSDSRRLDAPPDVVDELRAAVFEEGQSVGELRKRFNPVLRPKSPEQEAQELTRKTRTAIQRLLDLVRNLDGLTEKRVARVEAVLDAVMRDLDELDAAPAPTSKTGRKSKREATVR
ncbi:MAG: hypothetical protein OXU20_14200 [Myxococcales bacterium]|nr:hypothetical protein [Myxococcales bacterium]